jgi:hypothetical protein
VLYLASPAHNEVATIGVLLWRIRTVLAEFPREYEVVVYDDASTDETAAVASQYEQAMPVTVLRGSTHLGYAGAVDALLRHVAQQTRYPRRDAVLLLQGDFTDPPGIVPEFARRFEGGADLVVGERLVVADAPVAVRRLFKGAHWAMRPFVRIDGVKDMTASMRLVRISALRDALRAVGDAPLVTGDTWTANADLLLRLAPHARRVESVPMEPTYGVRMRETRRVAMRDALSALKWAWGARGRRASIGTRAEASPETDRKSGRTPGGKRREEAPELSVERLREKVRERDGSRGLDGEPEKPRDKRRGRERERPERTERAERPEREAPRAERPEKAERPARPEVAAERPSAERPAKPRRERPERGERQERTERAERPAAEPRAPKPPRGERPPRPRRDEPRVAASASLDLDDPFAPPAPKLDPFTRALDAVADSTPAIGESEAVSRTDAADIDRASDVGSETVADFIAPPRAPRIDANTLAGADDESGELDGDDDAGSDDEAAGDDATDGTGGEARRKRRRNRRSRRGRRRRENADGTEAEAAGDAGSGTESNGAGDAGAAEAVDVREGRPVRPRPARADADGDDRDESESDAASGADADGETSGEDGSPRARRRGRRGRRGGARRSRGRRDRGGESADGDGGDSGGGEPAAGGDE